MPVIAGYLMPHPPVLVPEVGHGKERVCQDTLDALNQVASLIRSQEPDMIVIITPHGPMFTDGLAIGGEAQLRGDLRAFGAPEISISQPNATDWVEKIIYEAGKIDVPVVRIDKHSATDYHISTDLDHGVLVPLYFVNKQWNKYRLIHITYGLLSISKLYAFGQMLKRLLLNGNEKTAVIASGDLSHCLKDDGPYSYHPDGPRFDIAAISRLKEGDFVGLLTLDNDMVKHAGECAFRSLAILGGALDGLELDSRCYSYEGPFGVGYGVCSFVACGLKESRFSVLQGKLDRALMERQSKEDPWVRLARDTIESFLKTGNPPAIPEDLPESMLTDRNGVFVSIKGPSGLRGCIGTLIPTTPSVAQEIIENAVRAATEDSRFPSVEIDELHELSISVDVLMPSEPIDSEKELDPKHYGVIVESGRKRGLLLPDIEGVDTPDEQIRIALRKAGIMKSENYTLKRFEVIRHH